MSSTVNSGPQTPGPLGAFANVLEWRLGWARRNLDYVPTGVHCDKLMSTRDAVGLIESNSVVASSGFGACGRCSVFFWALQSAFGRNAEPTGLTWVTVSAQGGRGLAPGTIEEIAIPGMVACYISGHLETAKAFLKLADEGRMELHTLPQGVMAHLLHGQASGKASLTTEIGKDTFLDPAHGGGTAVTTPAHRQFVEAKGKKLSYSLPLIQYGLISAPYVDREGNIYFGSSPTITENREIAAAAHHNGGKVLVTVGAFIDKDESAIDIPAAQVSAICVNPYYEQIGGIRLNRAWSMFLPGTNDSIDTSIAIVRRLNQVMRLTSKRTELDDVMARTATAIFARESRPGALVNIGVGMPEETGRLLYESGLYKDLTFTTEAGVYGGIPLPGIFFGASACPEKIESSYWMFRQYQEGLDISVLGFLQVDSAGNVNVSRRGRNAADYVGPGGFIDIWESAGTLIFVGSWMVKGELELTNGRIKVRKRGRAKFVRSVDEVTFNGQRALGKGKKIFYVTNVGVFQLTKRGLELVQVAPGIDIDNDIIAACDAEILLPEGGEVPELSAEIMTGRNFSLVWAEAGE